MLKCLNVKSSAGFTLMEAIVAIAIITVGIVGVFSLVTQTISSATLSKDKLIAAYLAQEGIEIVRNIRDTNWLEGAAWDVDLACCGSFPCDCEADYATQSLTDTYDGDFLNIDINDFYSYSNGTQTKFTRKITITDFGNYINVLVSVEWQERGRTHQVTVQENLYDWF